MRTTLHDPQDKTWWLRYGEEKEFMFVQVAKEYDLEAQINPERANNPCEPDLLVNGQLADLKVQNWPFYTCNKYCKGDGCVYDPLLTVSFNRKDYLRYKEKYPDIRIFFWTKWNNLIHHTPFSDLAKGIEFGYYSYHEYQNRFDDMLGNARGSYLIDLADLRRLTKRLALKDFM